MGDAVEALLLGLVQAIGREVTADPTIDPSRLKSLRRILETSPRWADALAAIEADGSLATASETPAMPRAGLPQRLPADIAFDVVVEAVRSGNPAAAISAALRRLRGSEPLVTFTWMTGIVLQEPIRLDDETELRSLTADEVSRCRTAGIFKRWGFSPRSTTVEVPAIVETHALDLRPDEIGAAAGASSGRWTSRRRPNVDAVLAALRMHATRPDLVGSLGSVTLHSRGSTFDAGSIPAFPDLAGGMLLMPWVVTDLKADYARLKRILAADGSSLAIAVRRFSMSYERRRAEDAVLDLAIALEALFSNGTTEATYRLSINGANFIDVPGHSRLEMRAWLAAAYSARSKIVHGSVPRKLPTRLMDDWHQGTSGLATDLRYVISLAIAKALDVTDGDPSQALADFERLALRPETQHAARSPAP